MMKDLEKMLMSGGGAPNQKMSPEDMQAKLDVVKELIESMQEAMGGQVKGGLDELMAAMKPEAVQEVAQDPSMGSEQAEPDIADLAGIDKEASAEGEAPEMEKAESMVASEKPDEDDSFFGKKKDKSKFYA